MNKKLQNRFESTLNKIKRNDIWSFEYFSDVPKINNSVLIEGLPGIGNVGKIAVDFLIDEVKAKKILEITSSTFPHSVFVNENNLVELPKIEMFYKKIAKKDFFFISGDVQPPDEKSCYDFSNLVLEIMKSQNCSEIVTLGGIGLSTLEKKPKLYCTANDKDIIKRYKITKNLSEKLYGIVGPIMGVSGLMVGLAKKYKQDAICILAETINHPLYIGISGAKEIVSLLDKKFSLGIDTKKLDKEIKELESSMLISNSLSQAAKQKEEKNCEKTNYIG